MKCIVNDEIYCLNSISKCKLHIAVVFLLLIIGLHFCFKCCEQLLKYMFILVTKIQ